jgi:hypothetical protein
MSYFPYGGQTTSCSKTRKWWSHASCHGNGHNYNIWLDILVFLYWPYSDRPFNYNFYTTLNILELYHISEVNVDGFSYFSLISVILFSNQDHPRLDTTLCDTVCQWLVAGTCRWFSLYTLVSSTKIAETIYTPFQNVRLICYLFWLCPAIFGKQFSGETSWNQFNNWKKKSLIDYTSPLAGFHLIMNSQL